MGSALEDIGLRAVEVDTAAQLLADPPAQGERPHALRLPLTGGRWPDFGSPEVVVRPGWVHWVSPASDGAAGLLGRQSKQQRQRTRGALARLAQLRMELHDPVDRDVLREWTTIYRGKLGRLRNGRDVASLFRRDVLDPDSGHALACWRRDDRLICGTVLKQDPEHSALISRFNAVDEDLRDAELPRAMLVAAADLAAARGFAWTTAGSDPNITGGLVNPGLSAYKLRIGFRPVPADLFGIQPTTYAERVLSLDGLGAPIVRFGYTGQPVPTRIGEYVDGQARLELVSVTAPGVPDAVLGTFPGHRRLVLDAPMAA